MTDDIKTGKPSNSRVVGIVFADGSWTMGHHTGSEWVTQCGTGLGAKRDGIVGYIEREKAEVMAKVRRGDRS